MPSYDLATDRTLLLLQAWHKPEAPNNWVTYQRNEALTSPNDASLRALTRHYNESHQQQLTQAVSTHLRADFSSKAFGCGACYHGPDLISKALSPMQHLFYGSVLNFPAA